MIVTNYAGAGMKRILLIDDDIDSLVTMSDVLSRSGYAVLSVTDAESAFSVFREDGGIDLVIADYQMPGSGYLAFMMALRLTMPDLPMILLTRHGNVDVSAEATSLGAFEYMTKPVRVDQLRRVVEAAFLDSKQADHREYAGIRMTDIRK
jgi:two-component system response regulator (stage 0 sporulation protein F)